MLRKNKDKGGKNRQKAEEKMSELLITLIAFKEFFDACVDLIIRNFMYRNKRQNGYYLNKYFNNMFTLVVFFLYLGRSEKQCFYNLRN